MWEQQGGRNPVLAAPGSNDYSGLIASSTNNKGRSKPHEFQGYPKKKPTISACNLIGSFAR
jgi:hypothetical protein